ncbi:hypothetical protein PR048_028920 [Dryococelus australis]|uniref:Uncharacterized protein n=1 Tax=Dryococelus australis TaxID=614101 RepID=A0ABQ9GFN8_9NEOP|nr:hypothetical protein PR048_028920 [Dryococelus australis]
MEECIHLCNIAQPQFYTTRTKEVPMRRDMAIGRAEDVFVHHAICKQAATFPISDLIASAKLARLFGSLESPRFVLDVGQMVRIELAPWKYLIHVERVYSIHEGSWVSTRQCVEAATWCSDCAIWRYIDLGTILLKHRNCDVDIDEPQSISTVHSRANRVRSPAGSLQALASENRAGRCCWSAGFLGDLPCPPPLHTGAAPYSPHFTLFGSQDFDVSCNTRVASLFSFSVRGGRGGTVARALAPPLRRTGFYSRRGRSQMFARGESYRSMPLVHNHLASPLSLFSVSRMSSFFALLVLDDQQYVVARRRLGVESECDERHAKLHLDGFIWAWVHRHTDRQCCQIPRTRKLDGRAPTLGGETGEGSVGQFTAITSFQPGDKAATLSPESQSALEPDIHEHSLILRRELGRKCVGGSRPNVLPVSDSALMLLGGGGHVLATLRIAETDVEATRHTARGLLARRRREQHTGPNERWSGRRERPRGCYWHPTDCPAHNSERGAVRYATSWPVACRVENYREEQPVNLERVAQIYSSTDPWGRGGVEVRLLASHLGEPGSIPGGVAPGFSRVGIAPDECRWSAGFLGDLPFPPPFNSGAATYLASSSLVLKTSRCFPTSTLDRSSKHICCFQSTRSTCFRSNYGLPRLNDDLTRQPRAPGGNPKQLSKTMRRHKHDCSNTLRKTKRSIYANVTLRAAYFIIGAADQEWWRWVSPAVVNRLLELTSGNMNKYACGVDVNEYLACLGDAFDTGLINMEFEQGHNVGYGRHGCGSVELPAVWFNFIELYDVTFLQQKFYVNDVVGPILCPPPERYVRLRPGKARRGSEELEEESPGHDWPFLPPPTPLCHGKPLTSHHHHYSLIDSWLFDGDAGVAAIQRTRDWRLVVGARVIHLAHSPGKKKPLRGLTSLDLSWNIPVSLSFSGTCRDPVRLESQPSVTSVRQSSVCIFVRQLKATHYNLSSVNPPERQHFSAKGHHGIRKLTCHYGDACLWDSGNPSDLQAAQSAACSTARRSVRLSVMQLVLHADTYGCGPPASLAEIQL